MSIIEKRIQDLGIALPSAPSPMASYVPVKRVGNLLYTSGQDCRIDGELIYTGKVGSDLTIEEGYEAAKIALINNLAIIKGAVGELDKVKQFVKMLGFVNSADNFTQQPYVLNGASDLLEDIFQERGKHARSAISANELPFDTPVEIEM